MIRVIPKPEHVGTFHPVHGTLTRTMVYEVEEINEIWEEAPPIEAPAPKKKAARKETE